MTTIVMLSWAMRIWLALFSLANADFRVISVALQQLSIDDASDGLSLPCYQIGGGSFDYLKCKGSLLLLRYKKDGTFSGIDLPTAEYLSVRRSASWKKMQGLWVARKLYLDLKDFYRISCVKYVPFIQDNMVCYGTDFVPIILLADVEQHAGLTFIQATLPDPTDRKKLQNAGCVFTARHCLIPCGEMFLVVVWCQGAFEVGVWSKM